MYWQIYHGKWSKYLFYIRFTEKIGNTTYAKIKSAGWVSMKINTFFVWNPICVKVISPTSVCVTSNPAVKETV